MHLQAIDIKERLLGVEDYEVALSVGHLASLYNYDMDKYDEAEKLYLRSIEIGNQCYRFRLTYFLFKFLLKGVCIVLVMSFGKPPCLIHF